MLIFPPVPYRPVRRLKRREGLPEPTPPGPGAPVLVAATYESMTSVTLTFDRAVSVIFTELQAIRVGDSTLGEAYHGEDFVVLSPTQLRVNVYYLEEYPGPATTLWTAAGQTGIVATDGGADWAGASDLYLPFP